MFQQLIAKGVTTHSSVRNIGLRCWNVFCFVLRNGTDNEIFNAVVRHVWIIINHLMPLLTVGILWTEPEASTASRFDFSSLQDCLPLTVSIFLKIIPIQVGYTSTVLTPHCLESDGRCGTYLYEPVHSCYLVVSLPSPKQQCTQHCFHREVHIPHGTPYEPDENTVIAEMQLSQTNVSGYYTDMMVIHPTFITGKWIFF